MLTGVEYVYGLGLRLCQLVLPMKSRSKHGADRFIGATRNMTLSLFYRNHNDIKYEGQTGTLAALGIFHVGHYINWH